MRTLPQACVEFVTSRHPALVRAAFLLCGSQADAEDLAQETVVRVVQRWGRVSQADDPVAYTNRVLVNVFMSGRARKWRGEVAHGELPDGPAGGDGTGAVDDRDALRRALLALPPRQRAAVVLRHYEQRPEAETAALMGCSVGTVKSLTSRGLATLRAQAPEPALEAEEAP